MITDKEFLNWGTKLPTADSQQSLLHVALSLYQDPKNTTEILVSKGTRGTHH